MATMRPAPASTAPIRPLRPTPPRPTMATELPGSILPVFTTAPTPVTTAQPNSAATSSGRLLSMTTIEPRSTTAYSA